MKIAICYFSGTGNTKKVVDEAVKALSSKGDSVTLFSMEEKKAPYLNDYDLLGFAYPIHAFNAPSIVLNYAKKIEKLVKKEKKSLFIIKTSGEPLALNNISSLKLRKILKRKGLILTNEYHYCMPYNIIFRHTDNMAYKMWDLAQRVIPIDCKEILEGKKSKLKRVPFGGFLAWVFRIEHWGGRLNGRHYKVNEKCINCGLCAKRCPTQNIRIENGEFHFGKNCLMCMRCSFYCPANAFKIGWFNKWKVNGAYNFNNPNESEEERHKKYCKKSYIKYFSRNEEKIKAELSKQ